MASRKVGGCLGSVLACHQVADVQNAVKAAQQVLADVRKVFSDKAATAKAAKGQGAAKARAAAKRSPKAKSNP